MAQANLKSLDSHFQFGDNWASYAKHIDERHIVEAGRGLLRLMAPGDVAGRTFLDIGCGSGIHALAAARLGARRVLAVDIDPRSVETTQALLDTHAAPVDCRAQVVSIFDLTPEQVGTFDVVYSWGVLHHTGDLDTAVRRAAALVSPGGLFVFALYRKTYTDALWGIEKRWFTRASPRAQAGAQAIYLALFKLALIASGRSFSAYEENYKSGRGMDFEHDVRDWLGGYPYETMAPHEIARVMAELGLSEVRSFARPGRPIGLFGSGCDEYVYRKT